ncbi:hypothetical protein Taro_038601 [Colocasia esculenta]|uniref:Uncharacterized protein n=1 Tax=Colocasia esculenta TaxID=4460 RepID=A0A843WMP8_COLES|nr:hypothetical protein [Colocasia esculenta]
MKGTSTCYSEVPQHKHPYEDYKKVVNTTLNHNYIMPSFRHNIIGETSTVSNPDNTTQEQPLSLTVTDERSNCRSTR